jgi:hypothetical protein
MVTTVTGPSRSTRTVPPPIPPPSARFVPAGWYPRVAWVTAGRRGCHHASTENAETGG